MTAGPVAEERVGGERVGFPALDTMRAVGAVFVLTTHVAFWSGAYTHRVWGTALARLDIGVALFFVLSGFLLSRPFLDRRETGRPAPAVGRFWWKRVLRIFPVYLVAATAAMLLLPGNHDSSLTQWLRTLTLTDLYVTPTLPAGLTQMWSLSTELAFYLVLPGLMWLSLGRARLGPLPTWRLSVVLLAMLLLSAAWILDLAGRVDTDAQVLLWLPSYLTWFAVGIALAAVHVLGARRPGHALAGVVAQLGRSPGACWTCAAAVFAVACTPVAGPALLVPATLGEVLTKNLLYAVASGLVLMPAVYADPASAFGRVMTTPPLRHVGHISYGIFCVHLLLLELIADWSDFPVFRGNGLVLFALTLGSSLLVSEVLYRAVELPASRLRGWSPRPRSWRGSSAAVSAASDTTTSS
jgi:peptidoglycan/LPS O-acetylase OafA/YrhL